MILLSILAIGLLLAIVESYDLFIPNFVVKKFLPRSVHDAFERQRQLRIWENDKSTKVDEIVVDNENNGNKGSGWNLLRHDRVTFYSMLIPYEFHKIIVEMRNRRNNDKNNNESINSEEKFIFSKEEE